MPDHMMNLLYKSINEVIMLFRLKRIVVFSLALSLLTVASELAAQEIQWQTAYELSGFKATPRYDETMRFISQLDDHSDRITTSTFGISPQGRDLVYLVYDRDGLSDPAAIRKTGRIVLMVQACIHPGESEGKDAMLTFLRDLVVDGSMTRHFEKVSLLFIPIFNVDGHERFGPYGRINQNGPVEMGWRTTAQNLNLNRDYLKADAPEMQAWLRLFDAWRPSFFIDTHTTDGADYQYVLTYALETGGNMVAPLTQWQEKTYLPYIEKEMHKAGFPIFPYVSFRQWHDPRSGLVSGVAGPMFSQGYTALRNCPGLLIETHMLKPYKIRVESTRKMIEASLEILNKQSDQLSRLIAEANDYTASTDFREKPFPLKFEVNMHDSSMVLFDGFAYDITKSALTGGDLFTYDNTKAVTFSLPLFNHAEVSNEVKLPEAYVIPPEWTEIIRRLELHGIRLTKLEEETELDVETYFFNFVSWHKNPYEGRQRLAQMQFETRRKTMPFAKGSALVPMDQPLAPLIAQMLEPRGNGSFLEWGFFNVIFEQKEYAESYVMEPLASKMCDSIPGLKEAFEAKKTENADFAANDWAQLNWFYSQTPWWDSHFMVYPVARIMKQ